MRQEKIIGIAMAVALALCVSSRARAQGQGGTADESHFYRFQRDDGSFSVSYPKIYHPGFTGLAPTREGAREQFASKGANTRFNRCGGSSGILCPGCTGLEDENCVRNAWNSRGEYRIPMIVIGGNATTLEGNPVGISQNELILPFTASDMVASASGTTVELGWSRFSPTSLGVNSDRTNSFNLYTMLSDERPNQFKPVCGSPSTTDTLGNITCGTADYRFRSFRLPSGQARTTTVNVAMDMPAGRVTPSSMILNECYECRVTTNNNEDCVAVIQEIARIQCDDNQNSPIASRGASVTDGNYIRHMCNTTEKVERLVAALARPRSHFGVTVDTVPVTTHCEGCLCHAESIIASRLP